MRRKFIGLAHEEREKRHYDNGARAKQEKPPWGLAACKRTVASSSVSEHVLGWPLPLRAGKIDPKMWQVSSLFRAYPLRGTP